MSRGYRCFRSILFWGHYLVPLPIHKCPSRGMKNISNKFHQGALTIIIFWVIFVVIALKLEEVEVSIHIHPLQQTTGNSFSA